MVVCVCKRINDKIIDQAISNGAKSFEELSEKCELGNDCGQCKSFAKEHIEKKLEQLNVSLIA